MNKWKLIVIVSCLGWSCSRPPLATDVQTFRDDHARVLQLEKEVAALREQVVDHTKSLAVLASIEELRNARLASSEKEMAALRVEVDFHDQRLDKTDKIDDLQSAAIADFNKMFDKLLSR